MTENWDLDERKIYFDLCLSQGKCQQLKKKKHQRLTESKQNLEMSSWCVSRGVAHVRMASFLSKNQALSMPTDTWQVCHCTSILADPKGAEKHSATVLSTLCDALEYFPIKIYDFQLKFSSFWFPAESSFPTKSETWVCKSQPPEQTPLLELYKDMAGWGWCHWRQIHTWDKYGSLCPLSNCQPLCHKKRSEMFAHIWFYQRRNNNHPGNPYELPSKMHFSSEKK